MPNLRLRFKRSVAGLAASLMLVAGLGAIAAPAGAASAATASAGLTDAPTCSVAAGDARFVRYIYMQILFRCPDAGGLAYWTAMLDSGMSRSQFSLIIDMSDENIINNNVNELYHGILDRDPTAAESAAAAASIRSSKSDARLIALLASSDEFYATLGGDADWLNVAYNSILDRNPDEAGAAYFTGVMGTQSTAATRFKVAIVLEHSAENAGDWTGSALGAAFHRSPDAGGLAYWSGWLLGPGHWQTFRMWTLMLASPEGYAFAQTQPELLQVS